MNKTERMEDGSILMTVKVDGKEQKRRCNIEVDTFSRGPKIQKLMPKLMDGEQIMESIGGEIQIVGGMRR